MSVFSGIMGKEGRQASLCSDYAIGQFRFLQRALLVHGHYFYWRISKLVQYCFYKNVAFITANIYFAIFSAFSAQVFILQLRNVTELVLNHPEMHYPMTLI